MSKAGATGFYLSNAAQGLFSVNSLTGPAFPARIIYIYWRRFIPRP
jgi:hypothetical protein